MKLALFLLLTLPVLSFSQSYSNPESVTYDAGSNTYLISNSDAGQIMRRAANGTLSVFKSGISPSPYGIDIVGNTVYACCGGNVYGYNLSNGNQVFSVNTGATFLNGITHDTNGSLFVSDFSNKRIYRVSIAGESSNLMASNLVQSPNGMQYDGDNNRLIFVNWGSNAPIKALSLVDSSVTVIATTSYSNCDGIAQDNAGNYYVSSWGVSGIVKFDSDFTNPEVVFTGLSQPADIFYNEYTDTLAVPATGNDNVFFYGLNSAVVAACSELTATINGTEITFGEAVFGTGDSVITVTITNDSEYGFAYPLAKLTPINALPEGMSFSAGSNEYEVFESAWNPEASAPAYFYFDVNQEIPENYILNFSIKLTNLSPSPIDTCYFEEEFQINLRPEDPLTIKNLSNNFNVFPNPSSGLIQVNSSELIKSIRIMNAQGKIILSEYINSKSVNYSLNPGFYLVECDYENSKSIKRIIIQ
ncbi:MAG: T9SS type A sorting domain-containing protein [Bacteroidia bacterium]